MGTLSVETVAVAELRNIGLQPDRLAPRPVALVVDDERMIADTLVAILRLHDFAAFAAYDAAGALEFASLIPPDVLVSDVLMPGMNGIELAIALTAAVPDCKVLLISGSARSSNERRFSVLAKPIHPTDLLARVAALGVSSALV